MDACGMDVVQLMFACDIGWIVAKYSASVGVSLASQSPTTSSLKVNPRRRNISVRSRKLSL